LIVGNDVQLTRLQIYSALVANGIIQDKRYGSFYYHLYRACKCGKLDSNLIYDSRGNHKHHCERRKFHVGDKVIIKRHQKGTPLWLRKELQLNNIRTITAILPPEGSYSVRYCLGNNGIGKSNIEFHPFVSSELEHYSKKTTAGRPRTKRIYTRHCKDTSSLNNEPLINPTMSPSISCVNCEVPV
jgi:hypothetical protein